MEDVVAGRSRFSDAALPLLKEHIDRLEEIGRGVESVLQRLSEVGVKERRAMADVAQVRLMNLQGWYDGFSRSCIKLSRAVSPRLEHSELDDTVRMAMDVRLAGLEGCLDSTKEALSSAHDYVSGLRR